MFLHSFNEYRSHDNLWRLIYRDLKWYVYRGPRFCQAFLTREGAEEAINVYRRRERSK